MRSHRAIWSFAVICVLAAVALTGIPRTATQIRKAQEAQADKPSAENELGRQMIAALESDPRARRAATQRLVESVAAQAETGGEQFEVQYAVGLLKFYGEGDLAAAEIAFRNAITLNPSWAWGYNGLAIVLYAAGRVEEAETNWNRAIELAPDWVRPYNDRAIQYRRAGYVREAGEQLRLALALNPNDATTRFNHAVWLDVTGDPMRARAEYEKALELDPEMPATLYNLACSYAREGRIEMAAPYLEKAIALNPTFREEAIADPDFDTVRDEVPYRRLIGPQ